MNTVDGFHTPMLDVDDVGLIRPGDLIVERRAVAGNASLRDALADNGAVAATPQDASNAGWRGGRGLDSTEWRDVVTGLNESGLELYTVPPDRATAVVDVAQAPGAHLNHVFFGQDFYHGGPGGPPAQVPAPGQPLFTDPPGSGDVSANVIVVDSGLPAGPALSELGLPPGVKGQKVLAPDGEPIMFKTDALDEAKDGRLGRTAGHGLFISGLIRRLAPTLRVRNYRVMWATGEVEESVLLATLKAIGGERGKVINLSLGAFLPANPLVATVIRDLAADNVIVAAAGNAGMDGRFRNQTMFPASMAEVIAVGAYDSAGGESRPWPHSNPADVYAPGVNLRSSFVNWSTAEEPDAFDGWASWSGTSFATAVVAATVAERLVGGNEVGTVAHDWLEALPTSPWPGKPPGVRAGKLLGLIAGLDLTVW